MSCKDISEGSCYYSFTVCSRNVFKSMESPQITDVTTLKILVCKVNLSITTLTVHRTGTDFSLKDMVKFKGLLKPSKCRKLQCFPQQGAVLLSLSQPGCHTYPSTEICMHGCLHLFIYLFLCNHCCKQVFTTLLFSARSCSRLSD